MPLVARGLSFHYPDTPVLEAVDVSVEPGLALAIVGPNGTGKTTLLRCLAGLLTPQRGEVTLEGRPMASLSRRDIARAISVVPQARPSAFAFSALEFVMMGFHARLGRFALESGAQRDRAHAALEALGVGALAQRSMNALSGGEAQRVVMARTIVSEANYWLLDEPTANLDVSHQVSLLDTVRKHCDGGGAAIAILHDLNLVERSFDRVLVLSGGHVAAAGPPEEVLQADLLQATYGVPMRRLQADGDAAWIVA